jgi:hypothetical protein
MDFNITSNSYAMLLASQTNLGKSLMDQALSDNAAQVTTFPDIYLNATSLPNFQRMVASGQARHGDTHAAQAASATATAASAASDVSAARKCHRVNPALPTIATIDMNAGLASGHLCLHALPARVPGAQQCTDNGQNGESLCALQVGAQKLPPSVLSITPCDRDCSCQSR